jgi:peptide/nickel transport system substrate-binding protein
MDWKRFDRARESASPLELDLVEAYAQGRVNRRDFVKRGAIIGLSMPFMGAIISACGGDDDDATGTADSGTAGSGTVGSGDTSGETTTPGTTANGGGATGGVITFASARPASALDPILMQDLAAYGLVAQSFEFLITSDATGNLTPGLAESWEPNEDGTVWTFTLRDGPTWMDTGEPVTSADVAATMDRLVAANNAGLAGVIAEGAVDASDPKVAVFNLESANGNLPTLVSIFNAQTPITPVDYETGTALEVRQSGSGPFKLVDYDVASGAVFERNPDWWGGPAKLDGVEFQFFDDIGAQVTAVTGGAVDAIVQFSVLGGDALINDSNFEVLAQQALTHRQVWMRVDEGPFTDVRVRQALALCFNRQQMVDTLFTGRADVANDHVIAPFLPFFNPDTPGQRPYDPEMAKQLLVDAGAEGLSVPMNFADQQEIPQLAALIQAGAQQAGFDIQLAQESLDTFYGNAWCPAEPADPPCSGATPLGIVDYGHRPTPDVYLNAAYSTGGVWNSSQYSNPDFDAAFGEYQAAIDVDAQTAAATKIQTIQNEDVPVGLPYFYNYLSGHRKGFRDVIVTALGQPILGNATQA